MIFVTVGTQKFPFNRLIKEIDLLIYNKELNEKVFAQIGYCDYIPSSISFKRFINPDEFEKRLNEATIVITHGGTSSIIKAIKKQKKVIAVPRFSKFKEHVDNHQSEITSLFHKENYIREIDDVRALRNEIDFIKNWDPTPYISSNQKILKLIKDYIEAN